MFTTSVKKFLFILIILGASCPAYAGENLNETGKLARNLKSSKYSPREKADICLKIVEIYTSVNPDSAIFYNKRAEEYTYQLEKSHQVHDTVSKRIRATVWTNYGMLYYIKGNFIKALKYHNKSQPLWKELKSDLEIGIGYNNIAVIEKNAGDFKEAENTFLKALKWVSKTKNKTKIAMIHNNLANLYKDMGNYKKALVHSLLSRDMRKNFLDENGLAASLNNVGSIYLKLNEPDSAEVNLLNALILAEKENNVRGLSFIHQNLAEVFIVKNDLEKALKHGELALEFSRKIKNPSSIAGAAEILAKIYAKQKNWEKAYQMQLLHAESKSQINPDEINRELIKSELKFEFDKERMLADKEVEKMLAIAEKQKEKQRTIIIAAIIISFLLITFTFILLKRNRILNSQKQLIENQNNERKVLLQEIHHRVKNNFQVVSSLLKLQAARITNKEVDAAIQEAINRIYAMSRVHEIIYKNETFAEIDPDKYINELVENLKQSFQNREVDIVVDVPKEALSINLSVPLGIIINELITNSFKHAFSNLQEDPKIHLQLILKDQRYILTYKDNGKGILQSKPGDSFGTELIQTMVHQLSGSMNIYSENEWSTVIQISFKGKQE